MGCKTSTGRPSSVTLFNTTISQKPLDCTDSKAHNFEKKQE